MSLALLLSVALTSMLVGCASDPAPKEDSESLRQAICSTGGGGGGGGDPCTGSNGFCPAECGYCFTSVSQRIELQNLWSCTTTGGGGSEGGACWPAADFNRSATSTQYGYGEEAAQNAACDIASSNATSACLASSGSICRAQAGAAFTRRGGCTQVSSEPNAGWQCSCEATVRCSYTF